MGEDRDSYPYRRRADESFEELRRRLQRAMVDAQTKTSQDRAAWELAGAAIDKARRSARHYGRR